MKKLLRVFGLLLFLFVSSFSINVYSTNAQNIPAPSEGYIRVDRDIINSGEKVYYRWTTPSINNSAKISFSCRKGFNVISTDKNYTALNNYPNLCNIGWLNVPANSSSFETTITISTSTSNASLIDVNASLQYLLSNGTTATSTAPGITIIPATTTVSIINSSVRGRPDIVVGKPDQIIAEFRLSTPNPIRITKLWFYQPSIERPNIANIGIFDGQGLVAPLEPYLHYHILNKPFDVKNGVSIFFLKGLVDSAPYNGIKLTLGMTNFEYIDLVTGKTGNMNNASVSTIGGRTVLFATSTTNFGAPEYTLISKNIYTQGSPQINSTTSMSTSTLLATFRFKIKAVGSDVVIPYNLNTLSSTTPTGFVNFNLFKNNINVPITSDNLYSVTYLSSDGSTLTSQVIKRGQEKEIIVNFNFLGRDKKGKPLSDGVCSVRLSSVRLLDSNGNFASTTFVSAADPKKWETNGVAFECGPTYSATTTSVTVINPNGWEKLLTGQAYRINWTGGSKRVDIWLLDAPTKVGQKIFSAIDNNGFKDWTVRKLIETFYNPSTGKVEKISGNYLIRIDCIESGCNDLSNLPFTISSTTPPVASTTPTLTPYPINIIRPNGDKYNAGSNVNINWRTEGVVPTVSIEILNSKGSEVMFLRSAVNNTGSYVYTIPVNTASGNYIVKIKGSNGAIATSYFTVYAVESTNAYPAVTPVATPVYTPTPTATPTYSPSPSYSPTPTPTYYPSPSYSPSPSTSASPSPSSSSGAYMDKGIYRASIWSAIKSLLGF